MICASLSIGYEKNQKADYFRFIMGFYYVFEEWLDKDLKQTLGKLFNGHLDSTKYKENRCYAPDHIMGDLPTVGQVLLCRELFKYQELDDSNRSNNKNQKILVCHTPTSEKRVVSILFDQTRVGNFISKIYFLHMPVGGGVVKNINNMLQQQKTVKDVQIVKILNQAFPKTNFPKTFILLVKIRVESFLSKTPIFLYINVFIILAFIDVYRASGLAEYDYRYYDIGEWIDICKLDNISEPQFMQIALQWSWQSFFLFD